KNKKFASSLCIRLGFANRHYIVEPCGTGGGLMLFWDDDVVIVNIYSQSFFIAVNFIDKSKDCSCWVVFVYLSSSKAERTLQWDYLVNEKSKWGPVWCIAGDWNAICRATDKKGGQRKSDRSFWDFNQFLAQIGVQEISLQGLPYTWTNNRAGLNYEEETLDRLFVSLDWLTTFPETKVTSWFRSASDHTMLVIFFSEAPGKFKKRFKFDKRWIRKEEVNEVVKQSWDTPAWGTPMYIIKEKIKRTRQALLSWSKYFRAEHASKISNLTLQLEELRKAGGDRDWDTWEKIQKELNEANVSEVIYWRQKARALWFREGDQNTKFFHAFVSQRRKMNSIVRLVTERNKI
ncbi:Unknown protein, partial [Striga hermonthica]